MSDSHDTSGSSPDKVSEHGRVANPDDGDPVAASAFNEHKATEGGGESGGGAYPNPHTGKAEKNDGLFSHGGQTDNGYHGTGQLGTQETGQGNANAPAKD